jgi:hypothetical protein
MSLFERKARTVRPHDTGATPVPPSFPPSFAPARTPDAVDPALDTDLARALQALQLLEDPPEPVRRVGRPSLVSSPLSPRVP